MCHPIGLPVVTERIGTHSSSPRSLEDLLRKRDENKFDVTAYQDYESGMTILKSYLPDKVSSLDFVSRQQGRFSLIGCG